MLVCNRPDLADQLLDGLGAAPQHRFVHQVTRAAGQIEQALNPHGFDPLPAPEKATATEPQDGLLSDAELEGALAKLGLSPNDPTISDNPIERRGSILRALGNAEKKLVAWAGIPGHNVTLKQIAQAAKPGWDHKRPEGVEAEFGIDVVRPDMRIAVVCRSPAFGGTATLFGTHTGPGAFYRLMPHNAMAASSLERMTH